MPYISCLNKISFFEITRKYTPAISTPIPDIINIAFIPRVNHRIPAAVLANREQTLAILVKNPMAVAVSDFAAILLINALDIPSVLAA